MAVKDILVDYDHKKVGVLKDSRQNPLTTSQRNSLAATLNSSHIGLAVYDSDQALIYHWNGTSFATNPASTSGLVPKGNIAFNATEPASPTLGDLYVFSTAGTNTWGGGSVAVQVGDQAYWDGTVWQYIQGNVIQATETVPGIAEIATQAETNAGSDDARIVTPAKLASWSTTKGFAKVYFASGLSLVANTPLTVNHALNLQNRDAFIADFKSSNSSAGVDIDSTDANNITLTSNIAITGTITIIGF